MIINKPFFLFLLIFFFSGCSSIQHTPPLLTDKHQSKAQRIAQLRALKNWQIKGKLAFIQKKQRESATLFWQFNEPMQSQKLNLTTYLGINVLSLTSKAQLHTIEVDNEIHQGNNLEALIYSLTQYNLPITAIHSWIKGLPFSTSDEIIYQENAPLPKTLQSHYNNQRWIINYSHYKEVSGVLLAHSLTIRQNDLLIKIKINKWKI